MRAIIKVYEILENYARQKDTITYGELCDQVNEICGTCYRPHKDTEFNDLLNVVSRKSHKNQDRKCLLSSIVVQKSNNLPSDGFFEQARTEFHYVFDDEKQFYEEQRDKTFAVYRS